MTTAVEADDLDVVRGAKPVLHGLRFAVPTGALTGLVGPIGTVSLITERRHSQPWGLAGGGPGAVGENWLLPQGDESRAEPLLDKCTIRLRAGDVLRMLTPGGGGWGAPSRVEIREMRLDDIERVQSVELAAGALFRAHAEPRIAACADHDPMAEHALREYVEAETAWVVTVDDAVAGFVVVEVFDGAAHVEEIAVHPEHGRQGHATRLLDTVADWARAQGLKAMTLTTFSDVAWNRPFYEARRFRVVEDDQQSAAMRAKVLHEEEAYALARELRVVMQRELNAPPIHVRDADEADLPAITELFNALIPTDTVAWREHLADDVEMRAWFDDQRTAGHPVLVATSSDEVVGYTTWTGFRYSSRFPGYRHSMELTIHVRGDHHGRGVGRALIDHLVERARTAGVHVLVAGVDAENSSSYEFHRRLGFVEVARMPEVGRKFERWLDLVLLQRIIEQRP